MNYIDEQLRTKIKTDIENGMSFRSKRPLPECNNRALICFLKKRPYYGDLLACLERHKNFESIGYLARCAVENRNLLSCDTCGKELTYTQSFMSNGKFGRHCSVKCAQNDPVLKTHIQNRLSSYLFKNFGVTNSMQLSANVEKAKKTFTEHYGTDNNMKSERGMSEYRKAMNERYGVDYTWQLSSVQAKRKQTCLNNLSVEFPLQSPGIINRAVKTKYRKNDGKYCSDHTARLRISSFIERYGTDNNMKSEAGMSEYRKSMNERYGVDYAWQLSSVREKSAQTNKKIYGFAYAMQNDIIKQKSFKNKTKSYLYDNVCFDSLPEIAVYIWLKDNGIRFEYQPDCDFSFWYNGRQKRYFPDFKVNGEYWEIKGNQFLKEDGTWQCIYDHLKDDLYEAKRQCALKYNVKILYQKDYQKYLDYIDGKYGKNYLKQFKKRV